jgi:alpha-L-fucosidase
MSDLPKIESIKQHSVPDWYNDAKLGIFIPWDLYSVPALAVTVIDLLESIKRDGRKLQK